MEEASDRHNHHRDRLLGAVGNCHIAELLRRNARFVVVHARDIHGHLVREVLPQLCVGHNHKLVCISQLDRVDRGTRCNDRCQVKMTKGPGHRSLVVDIVTQRYPSLGGSNAFRFVAMEWIVLLAKHTHQAASAREHGHSLPDIGDVQRVLLLVGQQCHGATLPQVHIRRGHGAPAPKDLLRSMHLACMRRLCVLCMHAKDVLGIHLVESQKCTPDRHRHRVVDGGRRRQSPQLLVKDMSGAVRNVPRDTCASERRVRAAINQTKQTLVFFATEIGYHKIKHTKRVMEANRVSNAIRHRVEMR